MTRNSGFIFPCIEFFEFMLSQNLFTWFFHFHYFCLYFLEPIIIIGTFFIDDSVVIISYVVMLMVLLQNCTISSMKDKENCFSFQYQLSRNFWLWFRIVGSSISSNPLGISFSLTHCDKESLWDSNWVFLSCNPFSLMAK